MFDEASIRGSMNCGNDKLASIIENNINRSRPTKTAAQGYRKHKELNQASVEDARNPIMYQSFTLEEGHLSPTSIKQIKDR